jgi:hypothetical protein|tara:strand:- start:561 stop:692 length:132 start_codon:yes stop_codon:yes gene_type:complete
VVRVGVRVEEVGEGTAEDALDALDLITSVDQVGPQDVEDGQAW